MKRVALRSSLCAAAIAVSFMAIQASAAPKQGVAFLEICRSGQSPTAACGRRAFEKWPDGSSASATPSAAVTRRDRYDFGSYGAIRGFGQ